MRKRLIEKFTKSKEGSLGYTLTELLVVIAIIAIVVAIAIPSVIAISRALKFKRVNDHAKSIFLAAQQNLTEMRSDGGLKPLQEAGGSVLTNIAGFPEEYKTEYVYTSNASANAAFELILPAGSVDGTVRAEQIIIEYNPITGNVYSVFYSEEDESILSDYQSQDGLPRDDKDARKRIMLGYYDGSGLNSSQIELEKTQASVEFVNGEEGIVRVLVPVPDDFFSSVDKYAQALEIDLTVTGEYSMVKAAENPPAENETAPVISFSMPIKDSATGLGPDCYVEYGNTIVVEYPIDSLVNMGSFANHSSNTYNSKALTEQMDETGFAVLPGENITIQADVTVDTAVSEVRVEVESGILSGVNPMFEYLQPSGSGGYVLAVSNGRNLQNLNAIAPTIAKQVDSVVFTSDIYWNDTVSYYNDKYDAKTSEPGYQNNAAENPARALPYFVPIHNEGLFGTAKFIFPGEGDGGLGEIINAIIGKIEEIFFGGFYNAKVPTLTDELDAASGVKHADIQGNGHKVYNLNIDSTRYVVPNVGEKGSVKNPDTDEYVETDLTGKFYATGENQIIDYCFTGLFGYVNTPIDDLHVVNPIVKGHEFTKETTVVQNYIQIGNWMIPIGTSRVNLYNNPATGALIGVGGFNTLVTDCSTYIDKDAHGFNPAYFYHGDFSKTAAQTWYGVSGEGAVGGLVGYAKSHRNVTGELTNDKAVLAFSKCFAAVPVTGNMRGTDDKDFGYSNGVGAFIGNSQITNFYNCYASGDVKATGTCVNPTDIGSLIPTGLQEILMGWFGPSGSATTFPYSGRTSMGAGGFVGSSHGTRYSNCFATGDVVATGDCAGGFVGFMSIDETFAYGNDTKVAQRTVFTDCYAVGSATNGNGRQENFSGGNGRVVFKLDTTMTYFVNDYYRLYAPYYAQNKAEPKYGTNGAMYVFRDSYYLSSDPDKAMENTNECAIPASYEVLQNLIGSHSTGTDGTGSTWIKARIKAIKAIVIDEDTDYVRVENDSGYGSHWKEVTTTYTYDTEYFIPNAPTLHNLYVSEYAESYDGGNNGWEAATPATTHSYELETAGAVYPFSKLYGMDYYGDWPSEPAAAGLAYYESYVNDDNTYYYFDRKSTATTTDHLSNVVDQDGYAVLSQKSDNVSVTIGTKTQSLSAKANGGETFEAGSSVYYIFVLNETLMDEAAKLCTNGSFYVPMTVSQAGDTYTMYFNPYVYLSQVNPVYGAKNAVQPAETDVPKTMYIRSARQFAGLSKLSNYWTANYSYIQQFSINANTYLWDDAAQDKKVASIGTSAKPFNASYRSANDNQFRIEGFQYANAASGLFGVVGSTGKIENLVVACTSVDLDNANASDVAVVAAHNGGTISNVDVSISGNVLLKGKTNAGLLAGYSSGTIKDCDISVAGNSASVNMTVSGTETNPGSVGGLVGRVEGSANTKAAVTGCTLNIVPKMTVTGANNAGGLIGHASHLTLSANEPLVTLTNMTANGAYAGGLAGWMENSEIKITDTADAVTVTVTSVKNANGYAAGVLGGGKNVTANSVDVTAGTITGKAAAGFLGTGTNVDPSYCEVVATGITGTKKAAGVACTVGAQSVFDYVTVNLATKVEATAGNAAGYAVEIAKEADVSNSSVTLNNTTIKASGSAAGFACTVAGDVYNSNGSTVLTSVVGHGTITGKNAAGFACDITGQVASSFVTPALAATKDAYRATDNSKLNVSATGTGENEGKAAGFALNVGEDATVRNCYALNSISGTNDKQKSGFVCTNKGEISGCMANVVITGGNAFVAENNGTVTRCYGWYGNDTETDEVITNAIVGKNCYSSYFVDLDIPDLHGIVDNAPQSVVLYDAHGSVSQNIVSPSSLSMSGIGELTSDDTDYTWIANGIADEFPFDNNLSEEPYDYPMLRAHYGDWVVAPSFAYGVAYYETYTDGSTKIQIYDKSDYTDTIEEQSLSTGCLQITTVSGEDNQSTQSTTESAFNADGIIKDAGYAIFCRTGEQNVFAVKNATVGSAPMTEFTNALLVNSKYPNAYAFYSLTGTDVLEMSVKGDTFIIDPRFANAIAEEANFSNYIVRTPEQLAQIGNAKNASFTQTHDIVVEASKQAETAANIAVGKTYAGDAAERKLTFVAPTKSWLNTVSGNVNNLTIEIQGNVSTPVVQTIEGTVSLTKLNVTGNVAANNSIFGIVSGKLTGASETTKLPIEIGGTVNGSLINSVDDANADVKIGNFAAATLPGCLIGEVKSGTVATGTISVDGAVGNVFGNVGGSVTVGTEGYTGDAIKTGAVTNVFGNITGGSVTVNGNINTGAATQVFGDLSSNNSTDKPNKVTVNGAISVGGTAKVFGTVGAPVEVKGLITTGDLTGNAIGAVGAELILNGITVGDVPAGSYVIAGFGNGTNQVSTGDVTVTKNIAGNVFGTVNGSVAVGTVSTKAAANIFGDVESGEVTTDSITVNGAAGQIFGDVDAPVTVNEQITVTGNLSGNVFGAVTAEVTVDGINVTEIAADKYVVASVGTNGDISTGNVVATAVKGNVFGTVSDGNLTAGTITVDSVAETNAILEAVTGGTVTLGEITIKPVVTEDEEGNETTTWADVPTLIGPVSTGSVSGANVTLGSAKITGSIFASVASGTVQNFNVTTTGAMSAPLVGGELGGTLDNVDVTAGSATVESGVLVNSVASGATVKNCNVTVTGEVKASGATVGGLTGTNAGTLSGNTVNVGKLTATGTNTTVGGLVGSNSGAISGADVTAAISYGGEGGVTIGGIVGDMTGGSLTDSKASGSIAPTKTLTNKGNIIGGAIGKISAGSVGDASTTNPTTVTTAVTVDTKWAGATKQVTSDTFGAGSALNKGPVGMFVGYAAGVTFTNCESTAANDTYQFIGEVTMATPVNVKNMDTTWNSNVLSVDALTAYSDEANTDGSYNASNSKITAVMKQDVKTVNKVATNLVNCQFQLGGDTKTQTYGADIHFYTCTSAPQNGFSISEPAKISFTSTSNLAYAVSYYENDAFEMTDTGLYYKIDDSTFGRAYVVMEKNVTKETWVPILGTVKRYEYKLYLYYINASGEKVLVGDPVSSGELKVEDTNEVTLTTGNGRLHTINTPVISNGNYLIVTATTAVGENGTSESIANVTTFDARKTLSNYVYVYNGATLTNGTSRAATSNIGANYYADVKNNAVDVLFTVNGLTYGEVNRFQLYPVTTVDNAYQLLTFTYQSAETDYQRQFVTFSPVTAGTVTALSEETIPADNGGETGNNT